MELSTEDVKRTLQEKLHHRMLSTAFKILLLAILELRFNLKYHAGMTGWYRAVIQIQYTRNTRGFTSESQPRGWGGG